MTAATRARLCCGSLRLLLGIARPYTALLAALDEALSVKVTRVRHIE
ncbi:hypothetical protein ACIOWI_36790 [Streptomyces sp. NPDC087659]